jgi:DNA end-binding protein Ku
VPDEKPERPAPHPVWSGMLTFGLVSIPVDLYPGTRAGGASLRMLGPDGTPLARRYYCSEENVALDDDQLVRGYEVEPGRYVVMTDEDLESLEPKKSREIDLQRFVEIEQIDPAYYGRSFFLVPSAGSSKAYFLLSSILRRTNRAGIGCFVMRDHEYWVAILSDGALLRAETLRLADEVRSSSSVDLPEKPQLANAVVEELEALIDEAADDKLNLDSLRDESEEKLLRLVQEKERRNQDVVRTRSAEAPAPETEVVDLMEVLKRRLLESAPKPKPAKAHRTGRARKAG